jgi:amino acid adenylation domain-containing protein
VLRHAQERPSALALRDGSTRLTYGELAQRVSALASGLGQFGVGPGDRVALHLGNSADFVTTALACLWLGAPFVALQVDSPAPRLLATVDDCDAALVVVGEGDDVALGGPRRVVATAGAVLEAAGPVVPPRADSARRPAYLVYTSGTTGRPKGVCIPADAFAWSVARTVEALGLDRSARALAVSAFHFDGSYGLVFPTLAAGGYLLVPARQDLLFLRRFYQLMAEEDITFTSFSPSYLRLVVSSRQLGRLAGCRLRALLLGGEPCVAEDIAKLWSVLPEVSVYNRYGPTETTIAVTTHRLRPEEVRAGRTPIGAPHPGVEFYLVGEDGSLVDQPGEAGELYIGGKQLMLGYWGDKQLSAGVLRTDVVPGRTLYKSGDLVSRDDNGLCTYIGRLDDVIKRNGVRISLAEVATALRGARGAEGAACALVERDGSAAIVAFVVAGPEVTVADLYEQAARVLPPSMLPDEVELVAALPMTAQGKVDRRRLLAESGRSAWPGGQG